MPLFLMLYGICEKSQLVIPKWPSHGMRTRMCFISQGCHFCWFTTQGWQQSVLIRSVKEVLMSNLRIFLTSSRSTGPHSLGKCGQLQPCTHTRSNSATMAPLVGEIWETLKKINFFHLLFFIICFPKTLWILLSCFIQTTPQQTIHKSFFCSILNSFCSPVNHVFRGWFQYDNLMSYQ